MKINSMQELTYVIRNSDSSELSHFHQSSTV